MEREGGDVARPDVIMSPPPPTGGMQDEQPAAPPVPPAGDVVVTDLTPEVRTPTRHRLAKAVSAPLRESWIRGYPGSRTIYFGRTIEL